MVDWKYDPKNYDADSHELIPVGDYRVRIEEAVEQVSRTGKEMIRLKLKVSGYNIPVWHYVVFDSSNEESRKRTDQRLGSIYDSFGIPCGNLNPYDWKGKTGGARIKNRPDDNGDMRLEIHYFLSRKKTERLPAFTEDNPKDEGKGDEAYGASIENFGFNIADLDVNGNETEIPF